MGVRNLNAPKGDNGRHPYEYKNFGWAIKKAIDFGAGMEHLNLCPELDEPMFGKNYKVKFMSIFAHNVENWYLIDLAVMLYGYTLAPLYATLGPETLAYVLNVTSSVTLSLTVNKIQKIIDLKETDQLPHLKNLIIMDGGKGLEKMKLAAENAGLTVYTFN